MSDKVIWDFLLSKLSNPYSAAALMGNLYVESKLNPKSLQSYYSKKWSITDEQYTDSVDKGTYESFTTDGAGYGLAQWTHWSRKESMLNYAKSSGTSIGNLNMQLNFLWRELQTYKTCMSILTKAKSVKEASDAIVTYYEKPRDQSEKARENRASYGLKYLSTFKNKTADKNVILTANRVNIRFGNGKEYAIIVQSDLGKTYEWVATAENGWHAIKLKNKIGWVSGEFSKVE